MIFDYYPQGNAQRHKYQAYVTPFPLPRPKHTHVPVKHPSRVGRDGQNLIWQYGWLLIWKRRYVTL